MSTKKMPLPKSGEIEKFPVSFDYNSDGKVISVYVPILERSFKGSDPIASARDAILDHIKKNTVSTANDEESQTTTADTYSISTDDSSQAGHSGVRL